MKPKKYSTCVLQILGFNNNLTFFSLMKFVEDADDDCVRIVDGLLDVLTKGQHTLTKKQIRTVGVTCLISGKHGTMLKF